MIYEATKKCGQWVVETAKTHGRSVVAVSGLVATSMANAAGPGPDFTTLTSGIDFSTAAAAVLAGYLLLANFGVVIKGGRVVLKALGIMPR
jgi:hypothetical protein